MDSNFTISVRVWHPTMEPASITAALGIQPERQWQAGESRSTPKGVPLKGVNPATYWTARIAQTSEAQLIDGVQKCIQLLEDRRSFVDSIIESGGVVELFIGLFCESHLGEHFEWHVLNRLAALRVNLSLDMYGRAESGDLAN